MPYLNFTRTEYLIFANICEREGVDDAKVRRVYTSYLKLNKSPEADAPQWKQDLWREAQERRHLHQHEEN